MEDLYFEDQFKELFSFYTWACYLGSISAFFIFCLEFLIPFGFQDWIYTMILIPFGFALSHKIIEIFPQYFNLTLAIINISLGGLIFILLYYFSQSHILFLAGQTVAMVQYSLLLGSNIILNISILLLNQLGLMILGSVIQSFFNSLQMMFILALILVVKSVWSNEKMKRQFFLLKHQNFQLHKHLDNVFQLKIIRCKLEQKQFKLKLLGKNHQAESVIKNQHDFTNFIREYVQTFVRTQTTLPGQLNTPRRITLEQLLFKIIEIEDNEKTTQIYSFRSKIAFKITIYKVIENGEVNMILLLQEDIDYEKMMKLNKQLKKSLVIQRKLFDCQEYAQQSLKYLKQFLYLLEVKGVFCQWNGKKLSQTFLKNMQLLENSQRFLLKSIHGYYNCLIQNNELFLFNKVIKFNKKRLIADFCKIKGIFEQKTIIKVKTDQSDFMIESNLTLILQLFLNLIQEQIMFRDYETIDINMEETEIEQIGVIFCKITLIHNSLQKCIEYDNPLQLDFVNQKILRIVGWKKEIKIKYNEMFDVVEFHLLQSIIDFQQ